MDLVFQLVSVEPSLQHIARTLQEERIQNSEALARAEEKCEAAYLENQALREKLQKSYAMELQNELDEVLEELEKAKEEHHDCAQELKVYRKRALQKELELMMAEGDQKDLEKELEKVYKKQEELQKELEYHKLFLRLYSQR